MKHWNQQDKYEGAKCNSDRVASIREWYRSQNAESCKELLRPRTLTGAVSKGRLGQLQVNASTAAFLIIGNTVYLYLV
jgi:hypothetical protein